MLAFSAAWTGELPDNDPTSPAEAASLVQAAAQILRFTKDPRAVEARAAVGRSFDQHLVPSGVFVRQGIWFRPTVKRNEFAGLFGTMLEAGFVLNPDYDAPGVIPELSPGEWVSWKTAAEQWAKERP